MMTGISVLGTHCKSRHSQKIPVPAIIFLLFASCTWMCITRKRYNNYYAIAILTHHNYYIEQQVHYTDVLISRFARVVCFPKYGHKL